MSGGASGRWADLMPRALSAIVMIAVGGGAIWAGGVLFDVMIALACGGMMWELVRMVAPGREGTSLALGSVSALVVLVVALIFSPLAAPLLALPAIIGFARVGEEYRWRFVCFALWITFAGLGFVWLRNGLGASWLVWLISVVVVTDVAGYFAGKAIGGPKFWPRISPKKTWSGTSAGWVAAAIVGAYFAAQTGHGLGLVLLSVLVSMASQAGDVAESALKRRTGVKDSSALIPGHGGLLDRFDGMLGAAVMFLMFTAIWG